MKKPRRRWRKMYRAIVRNTVWLSIFSLVFDCSLPAAQAQNSRKEYQLKAAFVNKFLGFIDWDASSARSNKVICVLGKNPFGSDLEQFASVNKNAEFDVQIRQLPDGGNFDGCNILYISDSEIPNFPSLLGKLKTLPIVTVSDVPGFASQGGVIELVVEGEYVRFIINAEGTRQRGIRMSSQLLVLAKNLISS